MTIADPLLRRVERTGVVVCAATAAAALILTRGNAAAAASVVAGGLLIAVSYVSMKSSVGAILPAGAVPGAQDSAPGRAGRRGRIAWTAAKMAGRYGLLALLAYVMIARLRLHPLGLLAGVSSVVAAVSIEAIRLQFQQKR